MTSVGQGFQEAKTNVERLITHPWLMAHDCEVVHIPGGRLAQLIKLYAPLNWLVTRVHSECRPATPRTHRFIDADCLLRSVEGFELLQTKSMHKFIICTLYVSVCVCVCVCV